MGLVCSGVEAEESDQAALPPLQVEAASQAFLSPGTQKEIKQLERIAQSSILRGEEITIGLTGL